MSGLITPATGAAHARIAGIGAYRPRRVVPNSEIVEAIDSSDEWIQERSGIKTRHFAGDGESVIDMSEAAVNGALEMAGMEAGEIDAVVFGRSAPSSGAQRPRQPRAADAIRPGAARAAAVRE